MAQQPNANNSGQYIPPPIQGKDETAYDFAWRYGIWLRTGGNVTIINSDGVGLSAIAGELATIQTEVEQAQALGAVSLLFADETIPDVSPIPPPPDSSGLLWLVWGDEQPSGRKGWAQIRQSATFGGQL